MMHLCGFVLLTLSVLGTSRRILRIDDSHDGAQQYSKSLTNALEVTAAEREALLPGGYGKALNSVNQAATGERTATRPQPSQETLSRRQVLSTAGSATLAAAITPAFAEATLVTRQQAYTRYVPRIERGRDFWQDTLRKYVANNDWTSILRELEPAKKKKAGGAIANVFPAMRLWSGSFSSKTVSEKTLAMNSAIDELYEASKTLEVAALGKVKGGFFDFVLGEKKMEDSQRATLAQASYKKGVAAFNKYIEIGNDDLGLQFAKLDTID